MYEALDRCCLRLDGPGWCVRVAGTGPSGLYRAGVRPGSAVRGDTPTPSIRRRFADPEAPLPHQAPPLFSPAAHPTSSGRPGALSPEEGLRRGWWPRRRGWCRADPVGGFFVLFGDGPERAEAVAADQRGRVCAGGSFVLSGFRADLDCFMPFLGLAGAAVVQPRACRTWCWRRSAAGGVPVVGVGGGWGRPRSWRTGRAGFLVPPPRPGGVGRPHHRGAGRRRPLARHGGCTAGSGVAGRVLLRRPRRKQYRLLFEELAMKTEAGRGARAEEIVPGKMPRDRGGGPVHAGSGRGGKPPGT